MFHRPPISTNSRLCRASSVAGHRLAFGADTVPGCDDDTRRGDLLCWSAPTPAWCHPVLFQRPESQQAAAAVRSRRARAAPYRDRRRGRLFLGVKPCTATACVRRRAPGCTSPRPARSIGYIERHPRIRKALARARTIACIVPRTALATGLSEPDVATFFKMVLPRRLALSTLYSKGVNHSARHRQGHAIINCHLARGVSQTRPSPFSVDRSTQCDGRPRGSVGSPITSPRILLPKWTSSRVAPVPGRRPRIAGDHEGLKAVQMFDAIRAARSRRCGDGHPSFVFRCRNADARTPL